MANSDLLNRLYDLVLDRDIRDWERTQLLEAKRQIEAGQAEKSVAGQLEAALRPLAVRGTLTPKVMAFYQGLGGHQILSGLDVPASSVVTKNLSAVTEIEKVPLENQERAIFAGGCFWCMVEPFDSRHGVLSIVSGFTGGKVENPTYDQVCSGTTGHLEAVEIIFDRTQISYESLLGIYWQLINPLDAGGQFLDRGPQYAPAIFVTTDEQRKLAEQSKIALEKSGKYDQPIIVPIREAEPFWPAEIYHQEWYKYNPNRYKVMEAARARYYKESRLLQGLNRFFKKG